ncbi:MAG: FprA family A-type flavoprotein [Hyphomonadaceae bacterium]|nr:FprA family A-type flavoprotein [Clostridia bacterium]
MAALQIATDIYSVGVQNPNLRVFDIIMKTDYGTTYNAYLVKGEKNALIETVHTDFFDEYIANIESVMPVSAIDYVILNHTEPDHSGSLKALLALNPNITVVASMAGSKYLEAITNRKFTGLTVRDNDTLDLGGRVLKFIIAPFLHWPDSMFTYIEQEGVLFSCDFLGCHYCEPQLLEQFIHYPSYYEHSFHYYYLAIFSPFRENVVNGLSKIQNLPLKMVCPSHGPVLIEGIQTAIGKYQAWSAKEQHEDKTVVIPYISAYGCTKRLAEELERALLEENIKVELFDIIHSRVGDIVHKIDQADGVLFGSPTINRDAVKPIWEVLTSIDAVHNKGKLCGVFGSYGWSGEAIKMLEERVKSLKFNLVGEGIRANFVPSEDELSTAYQYGKQFATALLEIK